LAGLVGAGLGVALAGWTGTRWSVTTGLWVYGLAQAVSNLVYVAIDLGGLPGIGGFIVAGVIDNACAAAAATVFVGFLMARCRPGLAATQYALLITITLLPPHALRFFGGLPDRIGWSATFVATALLVVPGLLLIRRVVVQPRS
jgi:PAT family beta-lactamase induction signal transducer AmpG